MKKETNYWDFYPLFDLLKRRNLKQNYLHQVITKSTVHKLKNNEAVRIDTISNVCRLLDVPIEQVVKIDRTKGINNDITD